MDFLNHKLHNSISSVLPFNENNINFNIDFYELNNKLQYCIENVLPITENLPKEYLKEIEYIINNLNKLKDLININVKTILELPSTKGLKLNDSETKIWLKKIGEMERIKLMPDVSETEYLKFCNELELCLDTWKSWNWDVPHFQTINDHEEILKTISINEECERSLTDNDLTYWLIFNYVSLQPDNYEEFINIFIRNKFYPLIDDWPIDNLLVTKIINMCSDINITSITMIFPDEWKFGEKTEELIKEYIIKKIQKNVKDNESVSSEFVELITNIILFEEEWNERFPNNKIIIKSYISNIASKILLPYINQEFIKIQEKIELDNELKVNECMLFRLIKMSKFLIFKFDNNHTVLRLITLYEKYWYNILKNMFEKSDWVSNIKVFNEHYTYFKELKKEIITSCTKIVSDKIKNDLFWSKLELNILEDSNEWQNIINNTNINNLTELCTEWSDNPIKYNYIERFIKKWIEIKLSPLLKHKKNKQLEESLAEIINLHNYLITIEKSEKWIVPLDHFINSLSYYIYNTNTLEYSINAKILSEGISNMKKYTFNKSKNMIDIIKSNIK